MSVVLQNYSLGRLNHFRRGSSTGSRDASLLDLRPVTLAYLQLGLEKQESGNWYWSDSSQQLKSAVPAAGTGDSRFRVC